MKIEAFYKWALIAMASFLTLGIVFKARTFFVTFELIGAIFAVVFAIMTVRSVIEWYKIKSATVDTKKQNHHPKQKQSVKK